VILAYHRIAVATVDPFDLCVPPAIFRQQMESLRATRHFVSLRELAELVHDGHLPPDAVAVTFDDGYVDNLTTASPVLLELGIPATFFVTTGGLAHPSRYWWDAFATLLEPESRLPEYLDFAPTGVRYALDSTTNREQAVRSLQTLVRFLPWHQRETILDGLLAQLPSALVPADARPLLASELQELAGRPGHEIGVHTVNHLSLPAQSYEVQRRELRDCQQQLQALVPNVLPAISYPFGDVDTRTAEIAGAAGFEIGVTASACPLHRGCDSLLLPRTIATASMFSTPLSLSPRAEAGRTTERTWHASGETGRGSRPSDDEAVGGSQTSGPPPTA